MIVMQSGAAAFSDPGEIKFDCSIVCVAQWPHFEVSLARLLTHTALQASKVTFAYFCYFVRFVRLHANSAGCKVL